MLANLVGPWGWSAGRIGSRLVSPFKCWWVTRTDPQHVQCKEKRRNTIHIHERSKTQIFVCRRSPRGREGILKLYEHLATFKYLATYMHVVVIGICLCSCVSSSKYVLVNCVRKLRFVARTTQHHRIKQSNQWVMHLIKCFVCSTCPQQAIMSIRNRQSEMAGSCVFQTLHDGSFSDQNVPALTSRLENQTTSIQKTVSLDRIICVLSCLRDLIEIFRINLRRPVRSMSPSSRTSLFGAQHQLSNVRW